jgi:hypothetical protein
MNGPSHYTASEDCLQAADQAATQAAATGYLLAAIAHAVLADVGLQAQRLGDVPVAEAWREALS